MTAVLLMSKFGGEPLAKAHAVADVDFMTRLGCKFTLSISAKMMV